jgi:hypothetical protein
LFYVTVPDLRTSDIPIPTLQVGPQPAMLDNGSEILKMGNMIQAWQL